MKSLIPEESLIPEDVVFFGVFCLAINAFQVILMQFIRLSVYYIFITEFAFDFLDNFLKKKKIFTKKKVLSYDEKTYI